MSIVSIPAVSVIWFVHGYGLAFGPDVGGVGLFGWGDWQLFGTIARASCCCSSAPRCTPSWWG
ncbi:ammonium transporter [Nonomuraea wenchangensis]|nr:ammonium transporter [Nonomuraea wenchangensis]